MLGFIRLIDRLHAFTGRVCGWLTLLMVLVGAGNALLRYAGKLAGDSYSSNAYIEAQWYLFSLVFLFGAAWTLKTDRHVRVDVFYGRRTERQKAWIDLVGGLLFLLPFVAAAIWFLYPSVERSWSIKEISPDAGGLPRWPIKVAALVAFGSLFLQGLAEILRRIAFLRGRLDTLEQEAPRTAGEEA